MVVLGIILIILGLLLNPILLWIGVVLLLVGLLFNFAPGPWGGTGGARRRYW